MDEPEDCHDLMEILSGLKRRVHDDRLIWCKGADGFETAVSQRGGLLLGGVWSPHFLRDRGENPDDIPLVKRLWKPRIVLVESATDPLKDWLPLLEAIAQAGESLLLVTREISTELLQTLIVNARKGTLSCAVACPPGEGIPEALGCMASSPPTKTDRVPLAAEAWARRTATVVFPAENEWRRETSEMEVISTGGESLEDQQRRLRYLVRAIQKTTRRF